MDILEVVVVNLSDKLPTLLVLAVLVGIFVSLRRHSPLHRVRLWILAWALIFLHFVVQVFEGRTGVLEGVIESIDLAALELAGIVFVISLTHALEFHEGRKAILGLVGVPVVFHAVAATFNWHLWKTMAFALAVGFLGCATVAFLDRRRSSFFRYSVVAVLAGAGTWATLAQLHGDPNPGVTAILTLGYGISGILFWKRYPRFSPGVVTVSGGFITWGLVFPVGMLLDRFYPALKVNPELWNVPKFFVAFGIILTLLEDKSRTIEENRAREHRENAVLARFSRATSKLLNGRNPAALCGEIAEAITQASGFCRAAILLALEDGTLSVAGSRGFSPVEEDALSRQMPQWTSNRIREICKSGVSFGGSSIRLGTGILQICLPESLRADAAQEGQHVSAEVVIPLRASRGSLLGWIVLTGPEESLREYSSELAKVEILAADLSVTIENTRLHSHLVRSEKLAALGQLVSGIAHELNNPLTGILGYAELLNEEAQQESVRARAGKLGVEARRMMRIVEGLLRFARQGNPQDGTASLDVALRDTLMIRDYTVRKHNVEVHTEIERELPKIAIGEDELKQVLLNLLNNALDAVEDSAQKSIRIVAECRNGRVQIRMEDSGPGFSDPNRAFDPFYTTKPVGKGTGLGLSICYGIVQERGGEIRLSNKEPFGACVTLDLPVSQGVPIHA